MIMQQLQPDNSKMVTPYAQMIDYIKSVQDGDESVLEDAVKANMPLLYSVARRYMGRGVEWEDLVQIGSIGLIKAIRKFDAQFETRFSTYAVPLIAGEIKRFLRDDGAIKVSRTIKEMAFRVLQAKEGFETHHNRAPTVQDLAEETGLSEGDILLSLDALRTPQSLSEIVGNDQDNSRSLEDHLSDQHELEPETVDRVLLNELITDLPERERILIHLRFFKECSQVQVAQILGVSQVQVSRIERRVLAKLRDEFVQDANGTDSS